MLAAPACLHVWLIPFEPASSDTGKPDRDWAAALTDGKVRILNYDPAYRDDIESKSREFIEDVARKIDGQRVTVATLEAFALEHDCPISIRYLQWSTLFEELERALAGKGADLPDIVQIGSSWAAYFADKGLLGAVDPTGSPPMAWRRVAYPRRQLSHCLRWTVDHRFLYYWKRPATSHAGVPEAIIDTESWASLLRSITHPTAGGSTGALVIPIDSYGANSLHYYVPFVWGGGSDFFQTDEPSVDLASANAMAVPKLFAQAAHLHPERLLFPEHSHPESDRDFVRGRYRATFSTLNLAHNWYLHFRANPVNQHRRFDDFAMVALPPTSFQGGSDLALTRWADERGRRSLAQELMSLLATDPALQAELVRSGDWPAQAMLQDVRSLLRRSWLDCQASCDSFLESLAGAIESARAPRVREYPAHPAFGRDMEDHVIRAAFLSLWREMGRYSKGQSEAASLEQAALAAQDLINRRIMGWSARAKQWSSRNVGMLLLLAVCLATVWAMAGLYSSRKSRKQTATMQQLQVMAASTVRSLDQRHISVRHSATFAKRCVVNEALIAWRRAEVLSPRLRDELQPVVCRAVVLAAARSRLGSRAPSALAAEWEEHARSHEPAALRTFLVEHAIALDVRLEGFVDHQEVAFPYLLEQALVCLTENALQGAFASNAHSVVLIAFNPRTREIRLESPTKIDTRIAALINDCEDAEQFSREAQKLNGAAELHERLGEEIRDLRRSLPKLGQRELHRIDAIEDELKDLYETSSRQWSRPCEQPSSPETRLARLDDLVRALPCIEVGVGLVEIKMIAASFFESLRVEPAGEKCVFVLRLRR